MGSQYQAGSTGWQQFSHDIEPFRSLGAELDPCSKPLINKDMTQWLHEVSETRGGGTGASRLVILLPYEHWRDETVEVDCKRNGKSVTWGKPNPLGLHAWLVN